MVIVIWNCVIFCKLFVLYMNNGYYLNIIKHGITVTVVKKKGAPFKYSQYNVENT